MSLHRFLLLVTIVLVSVVAMGGTAAAAPGDSYFFDTDEDEPPIEACAAEVPDGFADPENASTEDVIGWVDGYWYNEPLDIDVADGLSEEELEKLSARTAARFEAMRCLTFEEVPPIEIITREEFQTDANMTYADVDEQTRLFDNAQFETMLSIGSDEDSLEVREANRGETVGGFYNFQDNEIVVVSDDAESDGLRIDEEILAHELGHAVQDQQFNLSRYDRYKNDLDKGKLGVIEGDVHLIEQRYLEACETDRWEEPCLTEEDDPAEAGGEPANWALYFNDFQPYSDGPSFVKHVKEEGDGWTAIDALYEQMPRTALHVIYPEKYDEVEPYDLRVSDESDDEFERMNATEGEPNYNVIGQAGLAGMFVSPAYEVESHETDRVLSEYEGFIDPNQFLNFDAAGELDALDPIDYDQPAVNGWRGDRLYAYENDAGETGVVWKLAWADSDEADRFVAAYEDLIAFRDGEPTDYQGVYGFGPDSEFDMALSVQQQDDRVWIVKAPTVDDLPAVHGDVELTDRDDDLPDVGDDDEDDSGLPDTDGTDFPDIHDDGTNEADDVDGEPDTTEPETEEMEEFTPGFGAVVVIAALVGFAAIVRRR